MVSTIKLQLDDIILNTQDRLEAVARASILDVINDAQTPTGKGGNMRVDTGFLRASGRISFNGFPSGPVRGDPKQKYATDTSLYALEVAKMKIDGPTLFFGWTANYAKYREAYDGFLSAAIQKWPQIVAKNVSALKGRLGI